MKGLRIALLVLVVLFLLPKSVYAQSCSNLTVNPGSGTTTTTFKFEANECTGAATFDLRITPEGPNPIATFTLTQVPGTNKYASVLGPFPADRYNVVVMTGGTILANASFAVTATPPLGGGGSPAGGTAGVVQQGTACPGGHISTAIGCVPLTDVQGITRFFLQWAVGIAGGIALLLIGFSAYRISTSQGDPRRLQGGQELLLSAIGGLLMVVLSIYLLRFIGVNILGLF